MDVSSMLSNSNVDEVSTADTRKQSSSSNHPHHQYPTRHTGHAVDVQLVGIAEQSQRLHDDATAPSDFGGTSPVKQGQKHVVFQLIDHENPRIQARLPMRVMIKPSDTTESIITTVKNFYGLYEYGVSFENKDGISIIAAFDNFENNMTVYVRTVAQAPMPLLERARDSASPKKPTLGAPFELRHHVGLSPSRSHNARSAGVRSMSPSSEAGRRSISSKPRPLRTKSKDNSVMGDADGYGSDDNDQHSVTSSRRSKLEEIKAEITVDNIVEGGRRKRAFESSELPLFVPPQMPISASISSISPQRRNGPPSASPYSYSNQQTFSYTQPLPSPQSHGSGPNIYSGFTNPYTSQQPRRQLRGSRNASNRLSSSGILPTPDPTVGSVISDEDVALQLMRLGDPTTLSHGRVSLSTLDDALSGKADAASSEEESEDDDDDVEMDDDEDEPNFTNPRPLNDSAGPYRKKQRMMSDLPSDGTSGEEYDDVRDGNFHADGDSFNAEYEGHKLAKTKSKVRNSALHAISAKTSKVQSAALPKSKKAATSHPKTPMSPASLPQSRKASISSTINFQHQLGADEEDLSSKPRCQRCRKSKKGCDRQRPCGRCRDAGIGIEGCVSEDEGNGRKGRYGRHMGVPIKKSDEGLTDLAQIHAQTQHQHSHPHPNNSGSYFLAPAIPDKNKKRKR